jgi:hypothetical protein
LVSGTNIKTINGASVLGSGNIVTPLTPPSGVSGAIQFSNGSAFASDAANLFWDNTNKRLGAGTNAPTATAHIVGSGTTSATSALLVQNNSALIAFRITNDAKSSFGGLGNNGYFGINREADGGEMGSISTSGNGINIRGGASFINCNNNYSNTIGASVLALGAMWGIRGSGSTSATTSLLVQNSAGTMALSVKDNLETEFGGATTFNTLMAMRGGSFLFEASNAGYLMNANGLRFGNSIGLLFSSAGANSGSADTGFVRSAAGTLKVTNASSGYGAIDASLYKASGVNGFTGTGSYTNFTIVGGIITNAS